MSDFEEFSVESVVVRTRLSAAGLGDLFAAPVTHDLVQVDDSRRLVRGTDASQVVSETTIYDENTSRAGAYAVGSEVTLPSGRVATVIVLKHLTALGADLPAHLEVALT